MNSKYDVFSAPALVGRTQTSIEDLLINLNKSNQARRRLSLDVEYLRDQLEEMASSVIKSKIRIGELEATNQNLHVRLRETNSKYSLENFRQLIKKEIKEKKYAQSQLAASKLRVETLTNANITIQSQLNQLLEFSSKTTPEPAPSLDSYIAEQHSRLQSQSLNVSSSSYLSDDFEVEQLKITIKNLKSGFGKREKQLNNQLQEDIRIIRTLRQCLLNTKDNLREAVGCLVDQIVEAEDVVDADVEQEVNSFLDQHHILDCSITDDDDISFTRSFPTSPMNDPSYHRTIYGSQSMSVETTPPITPLIDNNDKIQHQHQHPLNILTSNDDLHRPVFQMKIQELEELVEVLETEIASSKTKEMELWKENVDLKMTVEKLKKSESVLHSSETLSLRQHLVQVEKELQNSKEQNIFLRKQLEIVHEDLNNASIQLQHEQGNFKLELDQLQQELLKVQKVKEYSDACLSEADEIILELKQVHESLLFENNKLTENKFSLQQLIDNQRNEILQLHKTIKELSSSSSTITTTSSTNHNPIPPSSRLSTLSSSSSSSGETSRENSETSEQNGSHNGGGSSSTSSQRESQNEDHYSSAAKWRVELFATEDNLKKCQMELYQSKNHIQSLMTEMETLRIHNQTYQLQLNENESQLEILGINFKNAQSTIATLQQEITDLKSTSTAFHRQWPQSPPTRNNYNTSEYNLIKSSSRSPVEVEEDLNDNSDNDVANYEIQTLKDQLEVERQRFEFLNATKNDLELQLQQTEEKHSKLRQQHGELQVNYTKLQTHVKTLEQVNGTLKSTITTLDENILLLKQQIENESSTSNTMDNTSPQDAIDTSSSLASNNNPPPSTTTTSSSYHTLQHSHISLQQEYTQLLSKYENSNQTLQQKQLECVTLQHQLTSKETDINHLNLIIEELRKTLSEVYDERVSMLQKIAKLEKLIKQQKETKELPSVPVKEFSLVNHSTQTDDINTVDSPPPPTTTTTSTIINNNSNNSNSPDKKITIEDLAVDSVSLSSLLLQEIESVQTNEDYVILKRQYDNLEQDFLDASHQAQVLHDDLLVKIQSYQDANSNLEQQLIQLKNNLLESEQRFSSQLSLLESKVSLADQMKQHDDELKEELQQQLKDAFLAIQKLNRNIEDISNKLESKDSEFNLVTSQLQEALHQVEVLSAQLEDYIEVKNQSVSLQLELQALETSQCDLRQELTVTKTLLDTANHTIIELHSQINTNETVISKLSMQSENAADLQHQLMQSQVNIQELQHLVKTQSEELQQIKDLQLQLQLSNDTINQLQDIIQQNEVELQDSESRLQLADQQIIQLQSEHNIALATMSTTMTNEIENKIKEWNENTEMTLQSVNNENNNKLMAQIADHEEYCFQTDAKLSTLNQEISTHQQQLSHYQHQITLGEHSNTQLTIQLQELTNQYKTLENLSEVTNAEHLQYVTSLEQQIHDISTSKEGVSRELLELQEKYQYLQHQLYEIDHNTNDQKLSLQTQNNELESLKQKLEIDIQNLTVEVETYKTTILQQEATIAQISTLNEEWQKYSQDQSTSLESKDKELFAIREALIEHETFRIAAQKETEEAKQVLHTIAELRSQITEMTTLRSLSSQPSSQHLVSVELGGFGLIDKDRKISSSFPNVPTASGRSTMPHPNPPANDEMVTVSSPPPSNGQKKVSATGWWSLDSDSAQGDITINPTSITSSPSPSFSSLSHKQPSPKRQEKLNSPQFIDDMSDGENEGGTSPSILDVIQNVATEASVSSLVRELSEVYNQLVVAISEVNSIRLSHNSSLEKIEELNITIEQLTETEMKMSQSYQEACQEIKTLSTRLSDYETNNKEMMSVIESINSQRLTLQASEMELKEKITTLTHTHQETLLLLEQMRMQQDGERVQLTCVGIIDDILTNIILQHYVKEATSTSSTQSEQQQLQYHQILTEKDNNIERLTTELSLLHKLSLASQEMLQSKDDVVVELEANLSNLSEELRATSLELEDKSSSYESLQKEYEIKIQQLSEDLTTKTTELSEIQSEILQLKDMIAFIKKDRQTEKEEFIRRIQDLLRQQEVITTQLQENQSKLTINEEELEIMINERNNFQQNYLTSLSELQSLQNLHQDKEQQYSTLEIENHQIKITLENCQLEITSLTQKYEELSQQYMNLELSSSNDLFEMKEEYDRVVVALDNSRKDLEFLESENSEKIRLIESLRDELKVKTKGSPANIEVPSNNNKMILNDKEISCLTSELEVLKKKLEDANDTSKSDEITSLTQQLQQIKAERSELQTTLATTHLEYDSLLHENAELKADLKVLSLRIEELELSERYLIEEMSLRNDLQINALSDVDSSSNNNNNNDMKALKEKSKKLKNTIVDLNTKLDVAESSLVESKNTIDILQSQIANLQQQQQQKKQQQPNHYSSHPSMTSSQDSSSGNNEFSNVNNYHTEFEEISKNISTWSDADITQLVTERDTLRDELRKALETAASNEAFADELYHSKNLLQNRMLELERSLEVIRAQEIRATARAEELEEYTTGLRSTINLLQTRCRDLENAAKDLLTTAESTESRLFSIEEEKKMMMADIVSEKAVIRELESKINKLTVDRDELKNNTQLLTRELEKTTTGNTEKEEQIVGLTKKLKEVSAKNHELIRRLEELEVEREGYKQMMIKAFEDASNKPGIPPPPRTGLIGGLIGNNQNNQQNKALQEQIAELNRQNNELRQLERLRPQLMELQQRLQQSQEESQKIQDKLTSEISSFQESNQQLTTSLGFSKANLNLATSEAAEAKLIIKQLNSRIIEIEKNEQEIKEELSQKQKQLQDITDTTPDVNIIKELEMKIEEISGERKHWQRKAQSLSKDMQKMLNSSADATQLKEENAKLVFRIEELMAERTAFRDAMQQTMEDVSPAMRLNQTTTTPIKRGGGGVGGVFKSSSSSSSLSAQKKK